MHLASVKLPQDLVPHKDEHPGLEWAEDGEAGVRDSGVGRTREHSEGEHGGEEPEERECMWGPEPWGVADRDW
jgi:hypothetical protein